MIKFLIIADDFTGTIDTSVQFSKIGIPTLVTIDTDIDFLEPECKDVQVLAINTESRHMSPREAYDIVYRIVSKAVKYGIPHIYKKTDSTLRGNIGSELQALMDAANSKNVMFVPAWPKNNRFTKDGVQYVNGIPISETIFSRDHYNPVKHSKVSDIIAEQSGVTVWDIGLGIKTQSLQEISKEGILVFDAVSDDDIMQIGIALKENNMLSIIAGCAAFAEILPNLIDFEYSSIDRKYAEKGNVLIVSGSLNRISFEQIKYAEDFLGFHSYVSTPEQRLDSSYHKSKSAYELYENINQKLINYGRFIISYGYNPDEMKLTVENSRKNSANIKMLHSTIANNIGKLVVKVIEKKNVNTLIVFGGDTLLGMMKNLGVDNISVITEIFPGVILSKLKLREYYLNLVTKAGGVSKEDIVKKILDFLS